MTYQRKPHQTAIGPLSKNSEQASHWTPPKADFSTPQRVTNAMSKGAYSQVAEFKNSAQRPGCLDFLSFSSRGIGC